MITQGTTLGPLGIGYLDPWGSFIPNLKDGFKL